jgi:hypothetical protein
MGLRARRFCVRRAIGVWRRGGTGAAQEAEEYGFSLIVEGVAGGYGVAEALCQAVFEELIAAAAGFLFGVAFGGRERG